MGTTSGGLLGLSTPPTRHDDNKMGLSTPPARHDDNKMGTTSELGCMALHGLPRHCMGYCRGHTATAALHGLLGMKLPPCTTASRLSQGAEQGLGRGGKGLSKMAMQVGRG